MRILVPGVGQGAGVLALRNGLAIAFDAGPDASAHLAGVLRREDARRCDVVVSHWDLDHVGGLDSMMARRLVARILHGAEPVDSWMRAKKAAWCSLAPEGCLLVAEGSRVDVLDGFALQFVRTSPEALTENDRAAVVRLVDANGEGVLLAPGDIDTGGEASLLARRPNLRARILLAGHHGSRGSSSLPFLGAAAPSVAFVQAGANNPYGHPHAEAMERLRAVVPDVRVIREGMADSVKL